MWVGRESVFRCQTCRCRGRWACHSLVAPGSSGLVPLGVRCIVFQEMTVGLQPTAPTAADQDKKNNKTVV